MVLPQGKAGIGQPCSNRVLFSSFTLSGDTCPRLLDTAVTGGYLPTDTIIHSLFIQAKLLDHLHILGDEVVGTLSSEGGFFRGHALLDGGEVDAGEVQDIVIDGFG